MTHSSLFLHARRRLSSIIEGNIYLYTAKSFRIYFPCVITFSGQKRNWMHALPVLLFLSCIHSEFVCFCWCSRNNNILWYLTVANTQGHSTVVLKAIGQLSHKYCCSWAFRIISASVMYILKLLTLFFFCLRDCSLRNFVNCCGWWRCRRSLVPAMEISTMGSETVITAHLSDLDKAVTTFFTCN
jgi:hypothetical protein